MDTLVDVLDLKKDSVTGPTRGRLAPSPFSRYACALEAQPDHLVPTWLIAEMGMGTSDVSQPLILNPFAFFQDAAGIAADAFLPESLYRDAWTIWVRDAVHGALTPYVLDETSVAILHGFPRGSRVGASMNPRIRRLLSFTSILVEPNYPARRLEEWQGAIGKFHDAWVEGFVPVRSLIHPFHIGALRRHYRRLIRTGALHLGDGQCALRFAGHNEDIARFFHHQLTSVVSQLVGRRVKPSYVYFISYQSGARLSAHVDRAQCQYTLAFCLDFSPEPDVQTPWPLQLETPAGRVVVYQAIGDALLYKGQEIPHFRDELPTGCTSSSLLFHYVDEDFGGRLT